VEGTARHTASLGFSQISSTAFALALVLLALTGSYAVAEKAQCLAMQRTIFRRSIGLYQFISVLSFNKFNKHSLVKNKESM
jgi:hypothetical protein